MPESQSKCLGSKTSNDSNIRQALSRHARQSLATAIDTWARQVGRDALEHLGFENTYIRPVYAHDGHAFALTALFAPPDRAMPRDRVSILRRGSAWRIHGALPPEVLPPALSGVIVPCIDDKHRHRLIRLPIDAPGVTIRRGPAGADTMPSLARLQIQAAPLAYDNVATEVATENLMRRLPDYLLWQTGVINGFIHGVIETLSNTGAGSRIRQRTDPHQRIRLEDLALAAATLKPGNDDRVNAQRRLTEVLRLRSSYTRLALDVVHADSDTARRLRSEVEFLTRYAPASDLLRTRRRGDRAFTHAA